MSKRLTTEEFIEKARIIHGNKYDYSKVEYVNGQIPIIVICPIHGEIEQTPTSHLKGTGCPKCGRLNSDKAKLKSQEKFIKQARIVHGDKYDYSKVKYINDRTHIIIICPIHGEFKQMPNHHLRGQGCTQCWNKLRRKSTEEFIRQAKEIHGDKYDYLKIEYVNNDTNIKIYCKQCDEYFEQLPRMHLQGHGHDKCRSNRPLTTEEFIEQAISIHGDKYDYSKVKYVSNNTKVKIICPIHGEFKQIPYVHISFKSGCPICKQSKLERKVKNILDNNNINYIPQHTFNWLVYKSNLKLDFYLPDYNVAIECQGKQHFEPIEYFGGEENFEKTKERDKLKYELCKEHNIEILYYADEKVNVPNDWSHYNVIRTLDDLLLKINEKKLQNNLDNSEKTINFAE